MPQFDPESDQVVIQVTAASLNPIDSYARLAPAAPGDPCARRKLVNGYLQGWPSVKVRACVRISRQRTCVCWHAQFPLPHGFGMDGAGIVIAVGNKVNRVAIGDQVYFGNWRHSHARTRVRGVARCRHLVPLVLSGRVRRHAS